MSDNLEHDELLRRLRAEDPASGDQRRERPGERAAVRARARGLLDSGARLSRPWILPAGRPRLAIAGIVGALAIAAGLILIIGGSSSGPTPALAIDRGERWVTLTLKDPAASDAEMNRELVDAGIDRVRVKSVPGPPNAVGTWAGYVLLGPFCQGSHFVNDVHIPSSSKRPATRATIYRTKGRFDLTLPRHSGVLSGVLRHSPPHGGALRVVKVPAFSKSTVRVRTASVDDPNQTAKVLIAVRPRSPNDAPDAYDIGVDQLMALGGVFAQYGEAVKSGHTSCADFGLKPLHQARPAAKPVPLRPGVKRVHQLRPAARPARREKR